MEPKDDPPELHPGADRVQTDESLRVERELADDALGEDLIAIEETADAVVGLARARADSVLAAARAKSDRRSSPEGSGRPGEVRRERAREDDVIEKARDDADEALRLERAEQLQILAAERAETNRDLSSERARADLTLTRRDEFLGVVSHELRNMLNTVAGFANQIEQEVAAGPGGERIRAHARRIQRSSARMNHLIGDLIDVASIDAGVLAVNREPCDPLHVLGEAIENFQALAAARGITLVVQTPASLGTVELDPARILQVLANLLANAIKFTPSQGTVTVRAGRVQEEIHFAVSDTGLGIPADRLEAVFERSVQVAPADRRGLGLGLFIARSIVLGHGGTIRAESEPGQGTSVRFELPVQS
jgi:signal transduction histidine kinase